MELWNYLALTGLGLVAGVLNVMAGGGSLLTLPAMIVMGFPPALANGTNRIALVAQNVTAVYSFERQGFADWRRSLTLGLCTVPGAVAGSVAAVEFDPLWFKRLLAVVMVAVLVSTLRGPRSGASTPTAAPATRGRLLLAHGGMVLAGFYGGFIQAGVGFLLMALLRGLLRLDLVRVNMHKVFVVLIYMVPSLAVFAYLDQVRWLAGLALAVGMAGGALVATRWQVKAGERPVRIVFAVAVVVLAVRLAVG